MRKGWSIDLGEWQRLAELIGQRTRWQSVTLTTNDQHMVPTMPGVYAICARPTVGITTSDTASFGQLACPIYIGKSESNIRSRFIRHCRSRDPDLYQAKRCYSPQRLRFWYIQLPSEEVGAIEGALIDCFGPVTNKRTEALKGKIGPAVPA